VQIHDSLLTSLYPITHKSSLFLNSSKYISQKIKHTFNLQKSDKLYILVGQKGPSSNRIGEATGGGGGGGTFVVDKTTANPLIIAAGGNGAGHKTFTTHGPDGLTTYDDSRAGDGGRGGQYTGNSATENGRAGGGGGMSGDGSIVKNDDDISFYYLIGKSFINGGIGGEQYKFRSELSQSNLYASGGFGGGGGSFKEGGGGGYVVGDVVNEDDYNTPQPTYGAGSFIQGEASGSVTSVGLNTGHGQVIITLL
jgi:hypothetical protein